jgi:hypothetical protein
MLLHPKHLLSASVLYIGQSLQESPQTPISGYFIFMITLFDVLILSLNIFFCVCVIPEGDKKVQEKRYQLEV